MLNPDVDDLFGDEEEEAEEAGGKVQDGGDGGQEKSGVGDDDASASAAKNKRSLRRAAEEKGERKSGGGIRLDLENVRVPDACFVVPVFGDKLEFPFRLSQQMDPKMHAKCEALMRRQICFKQLEFGQCTRGGSSSTGGGKRKCQQHHPRTVAFEDVANFFEIVKDNFPQMLPRLFQNRSDDRIHRLMGIYNANKRLFILDRPRFTVLYRGMLSQFGTMAADRTSAAFLRQLLWDLGECMGEVREEEYPVLIELVLEHVAILKHLVASVDVSYPFSAVPSKRRQHESSFRRRVTRTHGHW